MTFDIESPWFTGEPSLDLCADICREVTMLAAERYIIAARAELDRTHATRFCFLQTAGSLDATRLDVKVG